jgi:hypothetical protein
VCADLLTHRGDWQAVVFDTNALTGGGGLSGLIKLRDMAADCYNVDTLYILAIDEAAARRLAALAEPWLADNVQVYNQRDTNHRLGGCDDSPSTSSGRRLRLVTMWWVELARLRHRDFTRRGAADPARRAAVAEPGVPRHSEL